MVEICRRGNGGRDRASAFHSFRRLGGRRQAGRERANRASARSASAAGRRCCSINCPKAARIVALCDCNLPRAEAFKAKRARRLARLSGLPQDSRTERHRRGDRRHGRVSAGAALHPRLPGRQGHLRRKTADALHPAKAACWSTPCGSTIASSRSARSSARWP